MRTSGRAVTALSAIGSDSALGGHTDISLNYFLHTGILFSQICHTSSLVQSILHLYVVAIWGRMPALGRMPFGTHGRVLIDVLWALRVSGTSNPNGRK